eukprot:TRINITY_DN6323_c0_g1_i1.p1 TRINITY_DN6323_c0_g1~~TRINITY_DN6323_c0_g1_i1.p1  ORF type:complete len:391 (-),score=95.97 TRINITY_DN6323_c0_g1_i1:32-1204(-)
MRRFGARTCNRLVLGNSQSLWATEAVSTRWFSTSSNKPETYLITGGQGFVGGYVLKQLLEEKSGPKRIISLDWQKQDALLAQILTPSQISSVERVFGDIADTQFITSLIKDSQPDYIIHLAGQQIPTCRVDPIMGAKVNVLGTLNIFEGVKNFSADKTKCIAYASSAAIVGPQGDYPAGYSLKDDDKHIPRTHYGVFKTANEGNAKVYWWDHKIKSIGLRPFTVYGVGREIGMTSGPTKAVKYLTMKHLGLLDEAKLKQKYPISFVGKTSFNYVDDIANIFIKSVKSQPEGAPSVNIKGEVLDINEFLSISEKGFNAHFKQNIKITEQVSVSGNELPFAFDFDETGLTQILKSGGQGDVPFTSLQNSLPRIFDQFQRLQKEGKLKDNDLW